MNAAPAVEPSQPRVCREPRAVAVTATFVVRNIEAVSFEAAKDIASASMKTEIRKYRVRPFAQREANGSYTVEFR